jgi:hypothetical protein
MPAAGPSGRINPNQHTHRAALRTFGWLMLCAGVPLTLIGGVSFFSSFGSFGGGASAEYFWCAFVGLPLVGIGIALLKAGYMGSIARYVAGEMAPVGTDVLEHVAEQGKGSVRKLAQAVGDGLRAQAEAEVLCPGCGEGNEPDAQFCDGCGAALTRQVCAACGHANNAAARFCNRCGKGLTGQPT